MHPTDNRTKATMIENKPKNISVLSRGKSTFSDITGGQPRQGHGSGNRKRGNNINQRTNNRGGRGGNHDSSQTKKSSFDEACVELKGIIFDIC